MITIDYAQVMEIVEILKPLAMFVVGMAIYGIFIFKFYRFLAQREIFKLDLDKYNKAKHPVLKKGVEIFLYVVKNLVVFPVIAFFWFGILATLMAFLARDADVETILLISIAVVGATRICAYYNEELSKDMAKILPFALLGIFLIDIYYFSFENSIDVLKEFPQHVYTFLYYLMFIVFLEFIFSMVHTVRKYFRKRKQKKIDMKKKQAEVIEAA
ncbi:hypothetical protein HQ529_04375 [Candidatus Woesearchaeota archaeon]|nr:hypothetical protein [Candidatus Woesearchaeota archaeon]